MVYGGWWVATRSLLFDGSLSCCNAMMRRQASLAHRNDTITAHWLPAWPRTLYADLPRPPTRTLALISVLTIIEPM
eukprot:scaffold6898_cov149-Amphora_coffeaeformis.AAC.2